MRGSADLELESEQVIRQNMILELPYSWREQYKQVCDHRSSVTSNMGWFLKLFPTMQENYIYLEQVSKHL